MTGSKNRLPESLTTPFYEALLEDDVETVRKLIAATPSLTQTAFEGAEFDPEIASVAVRSRCSFLVFTCVLVSSSCLTCLPIGFAIG